MVTQFFSTAEIRELESWPADVGRDELVRYFRLTAEDVDWVNRTGRGAPTKLRELMREMGAAGRVQCGGWYKDMGRRLGLKIVYPFLDPDLAALTWSLPPQLLRDQGREKVILREALADLIPCSVYERTDKAEALALLHSGLTEAIQSVRTIACDGPLVDLGIIHPGRLHAAIDRYLSGGHSLAPVLWATTSVDAWLRHQNETEQK